MKKVFCIGFQKTGTTSMESALQALGYTVADVYGREHSYEDLKEKYVAQGLQIAAEHDAVQDMPWPLLYKELDKAFPGSRFILTLRDEDKWWNSIVGHFSWREDIIQKLTYGPDAGAPFGNEERYRSVYRDHNNEVLDYFKDRPDDLLVMDFPKDANWQTLCGFLGCEAPDMPFPHSNKPHEDPGLKRSLRRGIIRARGWVKKLG